MPSKFSKPILSQVETVDELRQTLDKALNILVTQLNNEKVTSEVDVNDYRITNVARPVALHDAVNVEFLKDILGRMSFPKRPKGGATGGGGVYELHWGLGVGGSPIVADYVAPPRIIAHACVPAKVYISCQVAPTGSSFICDVVNQSGTSMFGVTKIVLPAGATIRQVYSFTNIFASPLPTYTEGDSLSLNITQVGSTIRGGKIAVLIDMGLL